jgi:hypothetical protein
MIRMSPDTQLKLAHSRHALEREFEDTAPGVVAHEVEAEARRLLAGARFDNYIPVLVHRFAREHLRGRAA